MDGVAAKRKAERSSWMKLKMLRFQENTISIISTCSTPLETIFCRFFFVHWKTQCSYPSTSMTLRWSAEQLKNNVEVEEFKKNSEKPSTQREAEVVHQVFMKKQVIPSNINSHVIDDKKVEQL